METKKLLARTIVGEFWGAEAAAAAQEHFERTVQRKEVPDEIPEYRVREGDLLLDVVVSVGAAPSKREARRLFEQRAVTMDGLVMEPTTPARPGTIVQVGKRRWIRMVGPDPTDSLREAQDAAASHASQSNEKHGDYD